MHDSEESKKRVIDSAPLGLVLNLESNPGLTPLGYKLPPVPGCCLTSLGINDF